MVTEQAQAIAEPIEASQDADPTSEPTKEVPFTETPEYQLSLERAATSRAQQIANKNMGPLQSERDKLRSENSRLKEALGIKQTAEIDTWGDEPPVRELHKERLTLSERRADIETREKDTDAKQEELNKQESELDAWRVAIKTALPDGSELHSRLIDFVKELVSCTTDRERELLSQIRAKDFAAQGSGETPTAPRRPDVGRSAGSGSRRFTPSQIAGMSSEEYAANKDAIEEAIRTGLLR